MIALLSDAQAYNHQAYSRIDSNGLNSRLNTALDCFQQAARAAGPDGHVVICGDLFHDRKSLAIDVMDAVIRTLVEIAGKVRSLTISVGNHDQYLRDGTVHSLTGLKYRDNVTIVDDPAGEILLLNDTLLAIIPYSHDIERARQAVSDITDRALEVARQTPHFMLLAIHQSIVSAKMAGSRVATEGLTREDFNMDCWHAVVAGHYHKPQQLFGEEIYYIGSPYQVDWGEAGEEKRFLTFERGVIESVPFSDVPRFRRVTTSEWSELSDTDKQRDFFELEVSSLDEYEAAGSPANVVPVLRSAKPADHIETTGGTFSVEEAVRSWLTARGQERLIDTALQRLL